MVGEKGINADKMFRELNLQGRSLVEEEKVKMK